MITFSRTCTLSGEGGKAEETEAERQKGNRRSRKEAFGRKRSCIEVLIASNL